MRAYYAMNTMRALQCVHCFSLPARFPAFLKNACKESPKIGGIVRILKNYLF